MLERDICPLIIRLIFVAYNLNNAVVLWNGIKSETFNISNGIKQGGNLSPYLFAIYIDPLLDILNKSRYGCHVGHLSCNVLSFADDLTILSPTVAGLKCLLEKCEQFSIEYSLKFNPIKSKLIEFRSGLPLSFFSFQNSFQAQKRRNFRKEGRTLEGILEGILVFHNLK